MRVCSNGVVTWIPPPEGCIQVTNDLPNGAEILNALGEYCKACFPVTRDLGLLSKQRAPEWVEMLHVIKWTFMLADLIKSADAGCHFCGLFATRFFVNSAVYVRSRGFMPNGLVCCCRAPTGEKTDSLQNALVTLRSLLDENTSAELTFVAEPLDFAPSELSFGMVRFSAVSSQHMDQQALKRMVARVDIDLEFCALKGMPLSHPSVW